VGVGERTTRASWTVEGAAVDAAISRLSFEDHQRSVLAAYPPRRLNVSACSPLARQAATRSNQISVVVLDSMSSTMRYAVISSLDGVRAADTIEERVLDDLLDGVDLDPPAMKRRATTH
jgi:hypothetical protein